VFTRERAIEVLAQRWLGPVGATYPVGWHSAGGWSTIFEWGQVETPEDAQFGVPVVHWYMAHQWRSYSVGLWQPGVVGMGATVNSGRLASLAMSPQCRSEGLPGCATRGGMGYWDYHPLRPILAPWDRFGFWLAEMPHRVSLRPRLDGIPPEVWVASDVRDTVRSLGVPPELWLDLPDELTIMECAHPPNDDEGAE
jgi:hypothetical protein